MPREAPEGRAAVGRASLPGPLGALLRGVRDRTKTVDLKQVSRVLLQPHWRENRDAA